MGQDPISGKNFDHRKVWIEHYLRELAASFGIDLLGFAILSNHFHLILRSRPDVVATWDDEEVFDAVPPEAWTGWFADDPDAAGDQLDRRMSGSPG